MTVDQELTLGKLCAAEVARSYPVLADTQAEAYVTRVGRRIAARSDWAGLGFSFRIIDSEEVYTFSLPGGHVYVSRGMIQVVGTAAELAAVLAHEVAHVAARHGAEQVSRRYGLALVVQSLLGDNPAIGRTIVAELFTPQGVLAYGRQAEKEADQRAVAYLLRAGYDPRGLLQVVERLRTLEEEDTPAVARWRVTHEPARERLRRIKSELRRLTLTAELVSDEPELHDIKAKLQAGNK
ncbi:MAG: M48 family metalloprotease [Candidatus Oleimicrobiaceae bacterium]